MTQFSVPALETSNGEFESVPALRFTELLTQQPGNFGSASKLPRGPLVALRPRVEPRRILQGDARWILISAELTACSS